MTSIPPCPPYPPHPSPPIFPIPPYPNSIYPITTVSHPPLPYNPSYPLPYPHAPPRPPPHLPYKPHLPYNPHIHPPISTLPFPARRELSISVVLKVRSRPGTAGTPPGDSGTRGYSGGGVPAAAPPPSPSSPGPAAPRNAPAQRHRTAARRGPPSPAGFLLYEPQRSRTGPLRPPPHSWEPPSFIRSLHSGEPHTGDTPPFQKTPPSQGNTPIQ